MSERFYDERGGSLRRRERASGYADWNADSQLGNARPQSVCDLDVLVHRLEHVRWLVDHRVEALGDLVRRDVLHLDLCGVRLGKKLRINDELGDRVAQHRDAVRRRTKAHRVGTPDSEW